MKKRLLPLLFLFGAVAVTSCVRTEDLDLLKQPIHVQGEIDPNLGVPIAEGQMTFSDVFSLLSSTYSGMVDPDSNTITIYYEATKHDSIMAGNLITMPAMTKGTLVSVDTTIGYSVNINLFDDVSMQDIVDGNIDINHFFVNLNVGLVGRCGTNVSQGMKDTINSFVTAVFDSLVVTYEDHNGVVHTKSDVDMTPSVVRLDTIVDHYKSFSIKADMADIVNSMPRRVSAAIRFRFDIDESIFNLSFSNITYFNQLMDSIKLTKLIYDADLKVEFPFDIHIGYLPYSFTLDLGEGGLSSLNLDSMAAALGDADVDVELKESDLNFRFVNGIPMNINIATWMLDENKIPVGAPLIADTTIAASGTIDVGDNTAEADPANPTTTLVTMKLNKDMLDRLKQTRYMRFDMALHTNTGHVKIKKTDYLNVKALVKLHPSLNIDIPVTDDGLL